MQAIIGLFVFTLKTAPFQTFGRNSDYNWAANQRIGKRAAWQYLGQGEDTITLSGTLLPSITGGRISLDLLRAIADSGKAWPFIDGEGTIYGLWFVQSISETRTSLLKDGAARQIDFSLTLKRYDSSNTDQIGALARLGIGIIRR